MEQVVRLAAIDDDAMVRVGFPSWLSSRDDLAVTAVTATLDEFLAHPEAGRTDVVLLDLNLRDGVEPAHNITRLRTAGHRVLVISVNTDADLVLAAIEAGAAGYLVKNDDIDALADALRTVAVGGSVISPELAFAISRDRRPGRPALSAREKDVVTTYASGATLETTARRLGISLGTAKKHLERVKAKYRKAGRPAHTKVELAARLREDNEALDPPPGHPPSKPQA